MPMLLAWARSPTLPSWTFMLKTSVAERGSTPAKNSLEPPNSAWLKRSGLEPPTCGNLAMSLASCGLKPPKAAPKPEPVLIT